MPTNDSVEAFGKLIFRPREKSYPVLPDLNILIFKHSNDNGVYSYTAVCIQLELDTCGNSILEAKKELIQAIELYINAQARSCNSLEEFVPEIINTIYSPSKQKKELFNLYQDSKRKYLISRAQKSNVQMPVIEPSCMASFLFKNDIKLSPAVAI